MSLEASYLICVFQIKDVISSLLFNLPDQENILVTTYKMTVTIMSKVLTINKQ